MSGEIDIGKIALVGIVILSLGVNAFLVLNPIVKIEKEECIPIIKYIYDENQPSDENQTATETGLTQSPPSDAKPVFFMKANKTGNPVNAKCTVTTKIQDFEFTETFYFLDGNRLRRSNEYENKIFDGNHIYYWDNETSKGTKSKKEVEYLLITNTDFEDWKRFWEKNKSEFDCEENTVTEEDFALPTGVVFAEDEGA